MKLCIKIIAIREFITHKKSVPGFVKVDKISRLKDIYKVKDEENVIWTTSRPLLDDNEVEIPQIGLYAKINDDYQNAPQIIISGERSIKVYLENYRLDILKQDCLWKKNKPLIHFR